MSQQRKFFFASESVGEGHPDKVCDQISDAVLDAVLSGDKKGRVACETYITMGLVVVGGEITTQSYIDVPKLVRDVVKAIGYTHPKYGFDYHTCAILNAINKQSPDISQGVDAGGAGDQGIMIGYAIDETPELMPLSLMLAHKLVRRFAEVRDKGILKYLGPDCKSQVTVEYDNGKPKRVENVVLACQHTEDILDQTGHKITKAAREEMIKVVADPILKGLTDKNTKYFVNETGKFVVGGPQSDTGMTGRKIIVDTYGGRTAHGGGAFSGKDPSKVDRSATYMARYVAKNIVAAGLARECFIQLAYCIGVAEPVNVFIDTYGTGVIADEKLEKAARRIFDLTPKGIIEVLDLLKPKYLKTACYGHFGRHEDSFTWEKTDKVEALKKEIK
ncbi:MAG: methionine adenosyltransferase [Candidatus Omnitrophica bacterium CG1_02_44_16]|nr:MAG: methionine adenosyltransferase [Candidatus Omnitrophica bacterium CG1_02_44_16]PIY83932.1 MAG: methionine adenosyltransferase [Candidatus Omnitrophica bacterium CG_4_10_14_0_8_um_filter_44_12]PIZ85149.1 MAG: methionine adenosyltransferase [Candidatus Omnitrophica bacterium CG_4_10_14_0_2_um_filter_44_9]